MRLQGASRDHNVLAGSVAGCDFPPPFYGYRVVSRFDVTVCHADRPGTIDVDSIRIDQPEVVENCDPFDQNTVATGRTHRPRWGVHNPDIAHHDILASQKNNRLGAGIFSLGVGLKPLGDEGLRVPVQRAVTVDCHIRRLVGENPEPAEVGFPEKFQVVVVDIVFNVRRGEEGRAVLEMQAHARFENDGTRHEALACRHHHRAAALGGRRVDGRLNCVRIVYGAGRHCAVVGDEVVH